jgi:hypothetical protein
MSLYGRRLRYPPDARVFLQQLMFRLQPVVNIVSISAAALDKDLIRAQLNFLTRGMRGFLCGIGIGQHILAPRRDLPGWWVRRKGERHSSASDI